MELNRTGSIGLARRGRGGEESTGPAAQDRSGQDRIEPRWDWGGINWQQRKG